MRPGVKLLLAGAALAPVGYALIRGYVQLVIALARLLGTV